jgi:hypothetical protein
MRGRMVPNENAASGYSTATRTSTEPIVLEVFVLSFIRQKGLRPYSSNIRGTLTLLQEYFLEFFVRTDAFCSQVITIGAL